ncbi:serine/arginine repetitive matrix protein 2-like [Eriocheir sinensis]|uniref:serine/arginine repetitive matrix protein 2-like n=1 Tax=Eriocheir sinensis TaxID=95602 RepID=UPI0021C6AF1E|nr:serine/arginine repetitive matrix protein 2-like [Eriocheir sinensis]
MEATGVDAFWTQGHVGSPWSPVSGGGGGGAGGGAVPSSSSARYFEPPPYLDFDALQVALTRLDHSPQKGKGCVGRSGAQPPPPSLRGSRRSSADSLHLLQDQHGLDENEDDARPRPPCPPCRTGGASTGVTPLGTPPQHDARQELRRRLLQGRARRTPTGGSNPLLTSVTSEAEEAFRRIKEEVARLAAKRRSSSDLLDSRAGSDLLWSGDDSVGDSASVALGRGGEEQRSSSEADVVISDRESVASSGQVSRRTVITISSKKSKSASSLASSQDSAPLWLRDQQTRRSLRGDRQPLEAGISVSIVSRDATSRMYVRQSDAEDRPSRASAFNVRQTIEKRQIQQERRERRALRERIREQLRSLSEGRQRRDSSGSRGSSGQLSESSARSKSMSSLDQDQEEERSESPLVKVQSSPTLEREKEAVLTYLYGASNLAEDLRPPRPTPPPRTCSERREAPEGECSDPWKWSRSWDPLRTGREEPPPQDSAAKSAECVAGVGLGGRGADRPSGAREHSPPRPAWRRHLPETSCKSSSPCDPTGPSVDLTERREPPQGREDPPPGPQPVPPPRRNKLSLSTGHIKLEEEEQPHWVRLAKERRSLRAARQVEQLSDRASTASREPEWVGRARRKLESLNVTLTATTDVSCASSCVTESSSAWSRGGLDALDDLREETTRIGQELAEEAATRVEAELAVARDSSRMLEAPAEPAGDTASPERPRVSFDAAATEASDGDSSNRRLRPRRAPREEVRFGDLKHDWGGAQSRAAKTVNGKPKEMRFGEVQVKEAAAEDVAAPEPRSPAPRPRANSSPAAPATGDSKRPVMRFGDTPLNLFPAAAPRGPQSSSKFESVAGPDPTQMTAAQLNQNVEEYDFPVPTGREDASELLHFLEESLRQAEAVPEVVSAADERPRPKSILKRRSVESVVQELRREAAGEARHKVQHHHHHSHHLHTSSLDWDCVGKGGAAHAPTTTITTTAATSPNATATTTHTPPPNTTPTPSHTPTATPAASATNGSFFNIKLRHVSPHAREQQPATTTTPSPLTPPPTNNDPRPFPSEHSPHRRPLGALTPTQRQGAPLPLRQQEVRRGAGLLEARERKAAEDDHDQEANEDDEERERHGARELLPPPAWATCRAGRGLASSGAATHHPPAGPRGQDSGPQDTPPPRPSVPSCPRPAASPPGLPPSPPCRHDDVAPESDSVEVTDASARPPPIAFPRERPRWAGGGEGRLPTPTHPGTHPTHSAHPAANHHPLTPLPPAPPPAAGEPRSSALAAPPEHDSGPLASKARLHKESVLPGHDPVACPAPQRVPVLGLSPEPDPRSPAEARPRGLPVDSVTRPPRKKEEEEDLKGTGRGDPLATSMTPGERRPREARLSGESKARSPSRPSAAPPPHGPATPTKQSRGRPPGESPMPRLVHVEVVDEETRRGPRRREERRGGGGGLLEWEARQRQRLEEEERNRLNLGLSLRPVSSRIKELVRMHGAFMSRFSRDKKTDINGTVDGADDIFFQKIPQDPSTRPPAPQAPTPTMRSPYMVKKILSPAADPSPGPEPPRPTRRDHPRRRSPARRTSPAPRRASPAPRRTSPAPRRVSPAPSTRRASPAPRRASTGPRRSSPASHRSASHKSSPSPRRTSPAPRRRSSPSPRRSSPALRRSPSAHRTPGENRRVAPPHGVLTESNRQPSPGGEARDSLRRRLRSSTSPAARRRRPGASPDKKGGVHSVGEAALRASEILAELRRAAHASPATPSSPNKPGAATTPSAAPPRLDVKDGAGEPGSPETGDVAGRGSIKDPEARREWLTKMLTSLAPDPAPPPTPSPKLPAASPPDAPSHTSRSTLCFTPTCPAAAPATPVAPSRRASGVLNSPSRATPASPLQTTPHRSPGEGVSPVAPARRSALASLKTHDSLAPSSPPRTLSSSLTVTLVPPTSPPQPPTPPPPEDPITPASPPVPKTAPTTSTPAPASDVDSPVKGPVSGPDPLQQGSRRGPVSLASILSDSSRSSSRCSSPLASPRASPERLLKRDAADVAARLGVIPEGALRGERRGRGLGEDQKENIAPLSKLSGGEDAAPSVAAPFRSSFRLRERSEERRKGGRKWGEEDGPALSRRTALAAPTVTLRAMAATPLRPHADATWPPARAEASAKGVSAEEATGIYRNSRARASLRPECLRTDSGSRRPSTFPESGDGPDKDPPRGGAPVSLSDILSRREGAGSPESPAYKFSPKLSFSEELTHLNHRYRRDAAAPTSPTEAAAPPSPAPPSPAPPPAPAEAESAAAAPRPKQRLKQQLSTAGAAVGQRRPKEGSPAPRGAPRPTTPSSRNKVVRRNSSLKRNRPEDARTSLKAKKERRNSEEDSAHETVVEAGGSATHTRTTVKRSRLPAPDKARPVSRSGSGRCRREPSFRSTASRALEDWAASTSVPGKLVKKEGQRFSHETEEVERGGKRVARSVARRVVRRGSRTLSGGGELLTETKETSSSGLTKDGKQVKENGKKQDTSSRDNARTNEKETEALTGTRREKGEDAAAVVLANGEDHDEDEAGVSRKMRTSTDGERYMTHSVTDKHGAKTFTTEGVNNKTTSSVEVIGAKDFDARRAVKGTTGERVVVERTKDPLGRPSTVVKKVTSQSRLVITKTKRKTPVVV